MVSGLFPITLHEALQMKNDNPSALLITGGTDAMVAKKSCEQIIFLNNIQDIKKVIDCGEYISIGAGACYVSLISNPLVPEILKNAMRTIGSPAVRSAGTVAGNICNASPAGDTIPVLYALGAEVVLSSIEENEIVSRRIPINKFILGIRNIDIKENEILTEIDIPKQSYQVFSKVYYEKVGARRAEAISKLSFVGMYQIVDEKISDLRIAFGSVGVTALRFEEIEKKLIGKTINEMMLIKEDIVEEYMEHIHPIDDQRSTAEYRCQICRNLLNDFLA